MLSREEYERVVQTFLVELNHLCLNATEVELRALPRLAPEIDAYLADLRDPERDAAQELYSAFAYVDEYIGADWPKVAQAGYEAYLLSQRPADGKGK